VIPKPLATYRSLTVRLDQRREPVAVALVAGRQYTSAKLTAACNVATCGYNTNMETGVRELKDNLSRYIRRIEAGERIVITAHGRVVAELVPPAAGRHGRISQFDLLVASGVITPPVEDGDPLEDCPEIRLPPGTAAALIDSDRGEA
jgi:prevent-host-death family protein